jgi:hypothetical protein
MVNISGSHFFPTHFMSSMTGSEMVVSPAEASRRRAHESFWGHAFESIYQTYRTHPAHATALNHYTRSLNDSVLAHKISSR